MKKINILKKANIFKKLFIWIGRALGYEIIDQNEFYSPSLKKSLSEDLSVQGSKSIVLPLGNLKIDDENVINKILKNLNLNPKKFLLKTSEQKIKEDLKRRTNEACKLGIFGVPTFSVNNKIFWGQDRLEFALAEASK